MLNVNSAIERIKALECPTGDIENRVSGIIQEYGIAKSGGVRVSRNKKYDRDGVEAYNASIPEMEDHSIVILAKSGYDDYVARVVDAYLE